MKIDEFKYVCLKLGMEMYNDFSSDDMFFESLNSNSLTFYFTFKGYNFAVAKYVDKKAYIWHNGIYKVIGQQTPGNLEEQIKLFPKNYKEYLIQKKLKDIEKDFENEDNFFSTLNG